MRLPLQVAAAGLSALVFASPASAAFPDYPGQPRLHPAAQPFALPLAGPLESRFGYRWGRLHAGLDIAVLPTDRVRAALVGRVTAVGYLRSYSGYGNTVRIRHADGLATLYAHLASASVRPGEEVVRGQLIGRAGCTGSCTGPHLHFEVRMRGRLIDPLPFLRKTLR